MWQTNNQPCFSDYSNTYEVYEYSNSSSASIQPVSHSEYKFAFNKYGESCQIEKSVFSVNDILNSFSANLIKVEKLAHGTSYYAYSPNIKYRIQLQGQYINLHVFDGEDSLKIGSPIIFGSY